MSQVKVEQTSQNVEDEFQQLFFNKLDTIIELLTQLNEKSHNAVNQSHPCILNKSKFLNETQRERVLEFIKKPVVIEAISKSPKHKQSAKLQELIDDELQVKLSYYMTSKLVSFINNEASE